MGLTDLVPARVPAALSALRARLGGVVREGPVLFLAVVLGIAVTFRVTVGSARAAATEELPPRRSEMTPRSPPAPLPVATSSEVSPAVEREPSPPPRLRRPRERGRRSAPRKH